MKKLYLLSLALFGFVAFAGGADSVQAQRRDQLDYSACGCTPRHNGAFGGPAAADGLRWEIIPGAWLNFDPDDNEELICPIPFDHRTLTSTGTPRPVRVVVNVIDGHDRDEVRVDLMGQTASGDSVVLDTANTANPFTGTTSLTVEAIPSSSIRYLWLRVNVPDNQGSRSGVKGYQVTRP